MVKKDVYAPFSREEWIERLGTFKPGQFVINYNLGLRGQVTKVGRRLVHFTDQYGRLISLDPFTLHII